MKDDDNNTGSHAVRAPQDHISHDGVSVGYIRRHLQFGWWALLLFLILGIVLETLHAFKVGWYLDVGNEARRLTWRLAHAHGTFLGLVNVLFGLTLRLSSSWQGTSLLLASRSLIAATILIPGGFFLSGLWIYGGDPGLGVFLIPPGALLLALAVLLTARAARQQAVGDRQNPKSDTASSEPSE